MTGQSEIEASDRVRGIPVRHARPHADQAISGQSIFFKIGVIQKSKAFGWTSCCTWLCSFFYVLALLELWTIFIAAALRILPRFTAFCRSKSLNSLIW
jgi:hypothetical protein